MNEIVKDDKYTTAWNLNVRICQSAQMAQQNLYEVCVRLKEMRDTKLYKELGYQNFEEYCESEVGIKRRQAYNFISIAEAYGENVQLIAHFGTTKLALLAKLDEPQREEIQQDVDVEEISVKELKAEIDKLYEKEAGYKERQDKLLQKNKELVSDLQRSENERNRLEEDLDEARDTAHTLEKQIEELESRPRDSYEDTTKIDKLTAKLSEEQSRHAEEIERLRREYEKQPEKVVDTGILFKAYMQATVDSLKRLTVFCEQNIGDVNRPLFIEKLEKVNIITNQTIEKLKGAE